MNISSQSNQQGFLLTRHSWDRDGKAELVLWVKTDQGPARLTIKGQEPLFFIRASDLDTVARLFRQQNWQGRFRRLTLKTFDDEPVVGCYFPSIALFYQARDLLDANAIEHLEADIHLSERFLMERFITSAVSFEGFCQQRTGYLEVSEPRCTASDYRPNLSWVSLDIECSMSGELYSIGLFSELDQRVLMIGSAQESCDGCHIQWVADEKELLLALLAWFERYDPDLVLGWNVINFDFKLLVERAALHRVALCLGRGGARVSWRAFRGEPGTGAISMPGRVVLDGIATLKSATWSFACFSLESVAQELLGRGKDIEDVANRGQKITDLFNQDKIALARYNLEDCRLVWEIFEHCELIDFAIERASLTGLEMDRAGGSVAAFSNLYLPRLHRGATLPQTCLKGEGWQVPAAM